MERPGCNDCIRLAVCEVKSIDEQKDDIRLTERVSWQHTAQSGVQLRADCVRKIARRNPGVGWRDWFAFPAPRRGSRIVVTWVLAGELKSATPSYENKHQYPRLH